jgi:tetratricopeptide (TPR) repeat protein
MAQGHLDQVNSAAWARTTPQRLADAGVAIWFYLGKLVWPYPLMVGYPPWNFSASRWTSFLPLLAAMVAPGIFWLRRGTWGRPWFFAFAYFLIVLLPALGLIEHYILRYALAFDHFQYLASMGPLALLGAGIARAGQMAGPDWRWMPRGVTAVVLLLLATLTSDRAVVFQSDAGVWLDTVSKNPQSWIAYSNLGSTALFNGDDDQAEALFRHALQLNPNYETAENDLGNALRNQGKFSEAATHYRRALEINPRFDTAHNNYGKLLQVEGQTASAIAEYQQAVEINPENANAHTGLGSALMKMGRYDEAIAQLAAALELDPNSADAYYCLGTLAIDKQDLGAALASLLKSVELNPAKIEARTSLGWVLSRQRDWQDAIPQFTAALQLDPKLADAHTDLAIALAHNGQLDEALLHFQEVVRLKPGDKTAQQNLAQAEALLHPPAAKPAPPPAAGKSL